MFCTKQCFVQSNRLTKLSKLQTCAFLLLKLMGCGDRQARLLPRVSTLRLFFFKDGVTHNSVHKKTQAFYMLVQLDKWLPLQKVTSKQKPLLAFLSVQI